MARVEEVILSLNTLPGLTPAQRDALQRLGIQRVSDLLHFRPVHDAQLIVALSAGRIVHDFEIAPLVDTQHADKSPGELIVLPVESLAIVDDDAAGELQVHFGVQTVAQMAAFEPFMKAQQLVATRANAFSEPPSAPTELMPTIVGAIQNSISFSSFVSEKMLRLTDVELLYDEDREHFIDQRLAAIFAVRGFEGGRVGGLAARRLRTDLEKQTRVPTPELHLGYAVRLRQNWVNMGTFLGEVQHSLALAPGESRNIATIDWKRTHLTRRDEETSVKELLTNHLVHTRALDEVARSVALEHQFGGTAIAAGTASSAAATVVGAALVGGIAGAIPGGAIGAAAGGAIGSVFPVIGNAVGAEVGGGAGAVIGFGLGAAVAGGMAFVSTRNAQLGVVRSDSTGARAILADLAQDITEATSQKSSSIRSLWSTVFVSDTQAENENLQTRNVTNYNHCHALTIQYFEVLQHYRTEVELAAAEPLLFLPFRPLDFTLDLIADHWPVLRCGIADSQTLHRFEAIIGQSDATAGWPICTDQDRLVEIKVKVRRPHTIAFGGIEVRLLGLDSPRKELGEVVFFRFDNELCSASKVTGVQVLNLRPGELVEIIVTIRVEEQDSAERLMGQSSGFEKADDKGSLLFKLSGAVAEAAWGEEIERYFNARRYQFTRMLLLSIESEQLVDLVEALLFRRLYEVDIERPAFPGVAPERTGVAPSRPGFGARKLTIGSALGEAVRNRVRQVILADVSALQPSLPAESFRKIDVSIDQLANALQQRRVLPEVERSEMLTAAVAPLSIMLKAQGVAPEATLKVADRAKNLLLNLAKRLDANTFLLEEAVPLTAFVDPNPFAITGNTLVFRMRKPAAEIVGRRLVTDTQLREAGTFVDELGEFVQAELAKRNAVVRDIFLPTSGVFAEAVLGRANAAEKLDITRFFNWQDSPIPHLAPAIAQLAAGNRAQNPLNVDITAPDNTLNIVNPASFPDPTGMTGILSAIQNGNMFRDMSKAEQLVTVLGNLSQLAARTTEIAGTLAGNAQANALRAANEIAKTVGRLAQITLTPTDKGLDVNKPLNPDPGLDTPEPFPEDPDPPIEPPEWIPSDRPIPPDPLPETVPRIRHVRITMRTFVEAEVWEVKPSIGRLPTDWDLFKDALQRLISSSPGVDAFLAATRCNGQNRSFNRTDGDSMAEVTIEFNINTRTMEITDFYKNRSFSSARFYFATDTDDVPNKPEWFERLKPGKTHIGEISGYKLKVTDQNFSVSHKRSGQTAIVNIKLDAAPYFPFTATDLLEIPDFDIGPVNGKQAINFILGISTFNLNAEIDVTLVKRADGELMVQLSGSHDRFPCYEVYVNDEEAHIFSPELGDSPEKLWGEIRERKTISKPEFPLKRLR